MEPHPARCLCRLSDAKVIDCYTVRNVLLGGNPHASDIAGLPDAMPCNSPRFRCLHLHGSAFPSFAMRPLLPAPVLGAQFREQRAPSRDQ